MSYEIRPSFNLLPVVIKNLLILNALFLLATITLSQQFGIELSDFLSLHLFNSEKFRPYQLISYQFMHADFTHLASNMIALIIFGIKLENYWGPKRFLTYYLLTGVGGAVVYYLYLYINTFAPIVSQIDYFPGFESALQFRTFYESLPALPMNDALRQAMDHYNSVLVSSPYPGPVATAAAELLDQYRISLLNIPTIVGASGSVFGVLLAYGMMFPNSYPLFFIPLPAKWLVFIYGATEVWAEFQGNSDGIAHLAHLGGMLFGFFLIRFWQKRRNHF
jgi:membrane associated rhomboid family serine protease